jgi:HK97 family phage portal protein
MTVSLKDRIKAAFKGFTVARIPGQELTSLVRNSRTGINVTEETALYSVAVWACVRLLSETLASLPLFLYKRIDPRGKEKATDHFLYNLLHDAPNPEMTSMTFRETLMAHLVTWGNAYGLIDWEDYTTAKAIWPMRPDMVMVSREEGKIVYRYTVPREGRSIILPAYRVLHIPGLGFDGLIGYSPITMAREAIGLTMATEEFGARFFGNGAQPGLVIKHPGQMSPTSRDNFTKSWEESHKGLEKAHKAAILEEGMDVKAIGIPPEDAQFLETRKFQRGEIASFFHIPPHMIGDLEKATFSNIEQQSLEFVVYTMRPWLVRWEQAINMKLLNVNEQKDYFAEFLVDGLLRGDFVSRTQGYWTAIQGGWLSPNEIRELENKNPREGGDNYLQPVNMQISGQPPVQPAK